MHQAIMSSGNFKVHWTFIPFKKKENHMRFLSLIYTALIKKKKGLNWTAVDCVSGAPSRATAAVPLATGDLSKQLNGI